MPVHYGVDVNVISGSVHLDNVKTVEISYVDSSGNPVVFTKEPRLQITLLDASSQVPFKTRAIKSGVNYVGVIIGFQAKITIDLEWQVLERG
jgi:hypothetical protein